MSTQVKNIIRVVLDLGQLDDKGRADLLAAILQLGPQSALYLNNPAIHDGVTNLTKLGGVLKNAQDVVSAGEAQLKADKGTLEVTRQAFDKSLVFLKNLVENDASTEGDVLGMGFKARVGKGARTPLVPPQGVVVKPSKVHGKFTVSAQDSGPQRHYVAEISPDPMSASSFTVLPGNGKARVVTGYPTGTRLWVRFAAVLGREQSDWCTPVPIIVP
jgi:hypothetical protein